jgi:catechol 2,3-dioxygenase-like lactoylglutathione lyase family enzyme
MDSAGNLVILELKTLLPSKDFELSKRFYQDMGFQIGWSSERQAYLYQQKASFILTRYYVKDWAENLLMHLLVEDVEAWWQKIKSMDLPGKYGITTAPPEQRPWGIRDFTVHDPAGVLWRIGQDTEEDPVKTQSD